MISSTTFRVIAALHCNDQKEELSHYLAGLNAEVSFYNQVMKIDNPFIAALLNAKIAKVYASRARLETEVNISLYLKALKEQGLSTRQLERLTGISRIEHFKGITSRPVPVAINGVIKSVPTASGRRNFQCLIMRTLCLPLVPKGEGRLHLTRNLKDFSIPPVKAFSPDDFLKSM